MRGLIALVVILGVVGGVVMAGRTPTTSANTVQQPVTTGSGVEVIAPVRIVLEAETTTTIDAFDPKTKMQFLKIKTQSEGKPITYIDIEDKLIEKCGLEKEKDKVAALPGKATYDFEAPRDDTYYVFLRAKWYDTCGNSVWVRVDESSYMNLEDENGKLSERAYNWAWHALMQEGRPKGFKLTKGKHTLYMAVREDGPCLDQWLISSEASMPASSAPLSSK